MDTTISLTTLETPRLRLRPFRDADVDQLFALYSDPDVMRHMRGTRGREEAEAHVRFFIQQLAETGISQWAVEHKRDSRFIGRAGLGRLPGTSEVELGYVIARPYWGQGIATEASNVCVDFAFLQLGLPFITAITVPENVASLRVLTKLSFRFVREDRYYDTAVLYHRLDREAWLAAHEGTAGRTICTPKRAESCSVPRKSEANAPDERRLQPGQA